MALTVVQPGVGGTGATNLIYPSTGGTVTSYTVSGVTFWVHTFTTSGTYTA